MASSFEGSLGVYARNELGNRIRRSSQETRNRTASISLRLNSSSYVLYGIASRRVSRRFSLRRAQFLLIPSLPRLQGSSSAQPLSTECTESSPDPCERTHRRHAQPRADDKPLGEGRVVAHPIRVEREERRDEEEGEGEVSGDADEEEGKRLSERRRRKCRTDGISMRISLASLPRRPWSGASTRRRRRRGFGEGLRRASEGRGGGL